MYHIELMLTRYCNQRCYYCTTWKNNRNTEVDIDYLKYVLDFLPDEASVELTGGEIGLITNLDEVFRTVFDHKKIKKILAISNGLVRKLGYDWLRNVEYWEHLIYEIKGTEIIKFYHELRLDDPIVDFNVIVMTETTTRSLLTNWEWFEIRDFFDGSFYFKILNHKSLSPEDFKKYPVSSVQFAKDLIKFYTKIEDVWCMTMVYNLLLVNNMLDEKKICERYSPNPFVDFEAKELGHCAINVNISKRVPFNKENLESARYGKMFKNCRYCKTCYSFDYGKNKGPNNNRSFEI